MVADRTEETEWALLSRTRLDPAGLHLRSSIDLHASLAIVTVRWSSSSFSLIDCHKHLLLHRPASLSQAGVGAVAFDDDVVAMRMRMGMMTVTMATMLMEIKVKHHFADAIALFVAVRMIVAICCLHVG